MERSVRIAAEAERQIRAIAEFIAVDSPDNAARWARKLRVKIEALGAFPERHETAFSAEEAGLEVRQTLFGVYVIYYTSDDESVVVQAVRHGFRE